MSSKSNPVTADDLSSDSACIQNNMETTENKQTTALPYDPVMLRMFKKTKFYGHQQSANSQVKFNPFVISDQGKNLKGISMHFPHLQEDHIFPPSKESRQLYNV